MHPTEPITLATLHESKDRSSELRNFGLLVGSAFLAIGLWPLLRQADARTWAIALSILLILPALLKPDWLSFPHSAWLKIGAALGWFNTRLILGILYLVAILPIALVLRISGKTPLQLKFDKNAESYREKPDSDDDKNFTQQF